MRVLILDDDPERHQGFRTILNRMDTPPEFTHTHTVAQFANALKEGPFHFVCLDHDLETHPDRDLHPDTDRPMDGRDAVRILCQRRWGWEPKVVMVHSWNVPAGTEMEKMLRDYYKQRIRIFRKEYRAP